MASAIFFNNRRINIPGVYSKLEPSPLGTTSPGPSGFIGLVGTAVGGKPQTIETEFADATSAQSHRDKYRSGYLKYAGEFAFAPAVDPAIGGAQRVISVKVNTATQATLAVPANTNPDPSLDLTSSDWGAFADEINFIVAAGTTSGRKYTVTFQDITEVFDDVEASVMTLSYMPGTTGYTTMTGAFTSLAFVAAATHANIGLTNERTADIPSPGAIRVVSSDNSDTGNVLVVGVDGSGNAIFEIITLTGTTDADGTVSFTKFCGAVLLDGAATGTITISDTVIPTTLATIAPAATETGVDFAQGPCSGVVTVSASVDGAEDAIVIGYVGSQLQVERFDLTTALTTPVAGTKTFTKLLGLALGDVTISTTVTASFDALNILHTTSETLQNLVDRINEEAGFVATATVTNPTGFDPADADYAIAQDVLDPTVGTFKADIYAAVTAINQGSSLITAARATGAADPPLIGFDEFLTGGSEGASTATEWQSAFDLLKKRRINILVPLSNDAAIHAQALNHLNLRTNVLRSEANGYVGLGTVAGAGDTKTNVISRIQALQSYLLSGVAQEVERAHPDTGVSTWWPPFMLGAIAAGMQAGTPVAEPLTRKVPQVTNFRNDSSWDFLDDQEEMLDRALLFLESVDDVGIRWVRDLTMHLKDDSPIFTAIGAVESINISVFELRNAIEIKIGDRGLPGTVAAIKSLAINELDRQKEDEIIFAWRSLTVEQVGDAFPVSLEISPILGINFVPITVHVVVPVASAAA